MFLACIIFFFIIGGKLSTVFSQDKGGSDQNTSKCWNGVTNFARICYFTDGSVNLRGRGKFGLEDIDIELCTHIVYGFAILDEESLEEIKPGNPEIAIDQGLYEKFTNLRQKGVKVILSLGGRDDSTDKYSKMMNSAQHLAKLVPQISSFLSKHHFQGLEVAIEYPRPYVGEVETEVPEDRENFLTFLRELREQFDEDHKEGKLEERLTLSVAAPGRRVYVDLGFRVVQISKICDWISVMAYDIYNQFHDHTGLVAPFSLQPGTQAPYRQLSVQGFIGLWLRKGAPANKLALGVPFYGRPFRLKDKNENGLNAPVYHGFPDVAGEFTNKTDKWAFYEILDNKLKKGWTTVHYDYLGSSAYKDDLWIGYDDKFDVALKAEYTRMNCFFGMMVWALDLDCFQADCPGGTYPLLRTLKDVLTGVKTYRDVKNIT